MNTMKPARPKRTPAAKSPTIGDAEPGVVEAQRSPAPPPAQEASPEAEVEREQMIAEAAYYRAQRRGFAPGRELDDWLAAEAEISSAALQRESAGAELH